MPTGFARQRMCINERVLTDFMFIKSNNIGGKPQKKEGSVRIGNRRGLRWIVFPLAPRSIVVYCVPRCRKAIRPDMAELVLLLQNFNRICQE